MASTITIVFRGLLVFNKQKDPNTGEDFFEIGILDERPSHVPRIMTFKDGVRENTRLLETVMDKPPVLWKLEVDQPVKQGIVTRQASTDLINRLDQSVPEDDFRWIIDLEDQEFPYGNIDKRFMLNRFKFKHVVRVNTGEFYTRLKSAFLRRKPVNGTASDFGPVAGVIGCDIKVNTGKARLIGDDPSKPIFTFENDPHLLYEFSNSPPDTAGPDDHFHHYYEIFKHQPGVKFGFENKFGESGAASSGPNPALCGKIFLSQFDGTLVSS